MTEPGHIDQQDDRLQITGDWTLGHYRFLKRQVERLVQAREPSPHGIDLERLAALDTAGASLLAELVGAEPLAAIDDWAPDLPATRRALLRTVGEAMVGHSPPEPRPARPVRDFLAETGQRVEGLWQQQRLLLGFIGLTLATLADWTLARMADRQP